jgi:hypothetical protein
MANISEKQEVTLPGATRQFRPLSSAIPMHPDPAMHLTDSNQVQ